MMPRLPVSRPTTSLPRQITAPMSSDPSATCWARRVDSSINRPEGSLPGWFCSHPVEDAACDLLALVLLEHVRGSRDRSPQAVAPRQQLGERLPDLGPEDRVPVAEQDQGGDLPGPEIVAHPPHLSGARVAFPDRHQQWKG